MKKSTRLKMQKVEMQTPQSTRLSSERHPTERNVQAHRGIEEADEAMMQIELSRCLILGIHHQRIGGHLLPGLQATIHGAAK